MYCNIIVRKVYMRVSVLHNKHLYGTTINVKLPVSQSTPTFSTAAITTVMIMDGNPYNLKFGHPIL